MKKVFLFGLILALTQPAYALEVGIRCLFHNSANGKNTVRPLEKRFVATFHEASNSFHVTAAVRQKMMEACHTLQKPEYGVDPKISWDSPIGQWNRTLPVIDPNAPGETTIAQNDPASASHPVHPDESTPHPASAILPLCVRSSADDSPASIVTPDLSAVQAGLYDSPIEQAIAKLDQVRKQKDAQINAKILRYLPLESSGVMAIYPDDVKHKIAEYEADIMRHKRQYVTDVLDLIQKEVQNPRRSEDPALLLRLLGQNQATLKMDHLDYESYFGRITEATEKLDMMKDKLEEDLVALDHDIAQQEKLARTVPHAQNMMKIILTEREQMRKEIESLEKDLKTLEGVTMLNGRNREIPAKQRNLLQLTALKSKHDATEDHLQALTVHLDRFRAIEEEFEMNRLQKSDTKSQLTKINSAKTVAQKMQDDVGDGFAQEKKFFLESRARFLALMKVLEADNR
jgi:hypothetical protein